MDGDRYSPRESIFIAVLPPACLVPSARACPRVAFQNAGARLQNQPVPHLLLPGDALGFPVGSVVHPSHPRNSIVLVPRSRPQPRYGILEPNAHSFINSPLVSPALSSLPYPILCSATRTMWFIKVMAVAMAAMINPNLVAAASVFTPTRPPAVPLAVRSPYLNAWLQGGSSGCVLPGAWPRHWT